MTPANWASSPDLLQGTGVEFVQGWASHIDPDDRQVRVDTTEGEQVLEFDTLVYAIGSVTDVSTVPGVDAHAYTLNSPDAAVRLRGVESA